MAFVLAEHPKAYADKLEGGLFWIIRTPRLVQWTLPDLLLGSGMVEEDAWRDAASAIARKRARDRLMASLGGEFIEEEGPQRA